MQARLNPKNRPILAIFAALILVAGAIVGRARAQGQEMRDRIYVVTHVDIIPPQKDAGTKLVQQYVVDTRKDPGLVRIEAGAEISRGNHISLIEVWQNRKAFDEHVAAATHAPVPPANRPHAGQPL